MDVTAEILQVIADYKGIDVRTLSPSLTLEELDVDSLEAFDILWEMEQKFHIEIPLGAQEMRNAGTLGDVVDIVGAYVRAKLAEATEDA
jgi:acyl carrier protein